MKKRLSAVLMAALVVSACAGVSSSAAAEFGNGCVGNTVLPFASLVSVTNGPTSPLPAAAPISGVLTEWKLNIGLDEINPEEEEQARNAYTENLIVFRPADAGRYTVVAKAEGGALSFHGASTYLARLPIRQGDHLGLGGVVSFFCETTDPGDTAVSFLGNPPVGATATEDESGTEIQVPVVARIEADVDGDGYGDETQDKCPQSAAYQAPCPVVTISSLPQVGKKAVTVFVSTSLAAPVGVTATVALGKGKTATLTGAPQTVAAGSLTRFTLTLTGPVKKALKALPTKKSLTVAITASATNVTGSPSTSATKVKLKGQAKPVHPKRKPKRK